MAISVNATWCRVDGPLPFTHLLFILFLLLSNNLSLSQGLLEYGADDGAYPLRVVLRVSDIFQLLYGACEWTWKSKGYTRIGYAKYPCF